MKSLRFGTTVLAALARTYTDSVMAADCCGTWVGVLSDGGVVSGTFAGNDE